MQRARCKEVGRGVSEAPAESACASLAPRCVALSAQCVSSPLLCACTPGHNALAGCRPTCVRAAPHTHTLLPTPPPCTAKQHHAHSLTSAARARRAASASAAASRCSACTRDDPPPAALPCCCPPPSPCPAARLAASPHCWCCCNMLPGIGSSALGATSGLRCGTRHFARRCAQRPALLRLVDTGHTGVTLVHAPSPARHAAPKPPWLGAKPADGVVRHGGAARACVVRRLRSGLL